MGRETQHSTTVDPNPLRGGILCPNCGCAHHSVINTVQSESNFWGVKKQYIRRRRVCRHCQLPFHTREVVEPDLPTVIKSPAQAEKAREIVNETMNNVVPLTPEGLPNPFLPEK